MTYKPVEQCHPIYDYVIINNHTYMVCNTELHQGGIVHLHLYDKHRRKYESYWFPRGVYLKIDLRKNYQ